MTELKPIITDRQLDIILGAHELWLRTDGRQGCRADLQGARVVYTSLQNCNLMGADLMGADLSHTDMSGGVFRGADFTDADMSMAYLGYADFTHAKLPISIRSCSSFRYAQFSADALPWLVLHPYWSEMKHTVQIIDC